MIETCMRGMPVNSAGNCVELYQLQSSRLIESSNNKKVFVVFECYVASSI